MRPRGEVRQALASVAAQLSGGGATWRDMAELACVGADVAKQTVRNMASVGELAVVGEQRQPGLNRPMVLYAMPPALDADAGAALDAVVRSWADFR